MKVLFFSNEFPGPDDPQKAIFNLRMCEAMAGRHEVKVVVPVAWTQVLRRRARRPPLHVPAALEATYPTYYFVPRVMAHRRGLFMWLSVAPALRAMAARWRPDVILTYWTFPDGEVALKLAGELGVPVVQIVGGSDVLLPPRSGKTWRHIQAVLAAVDQVVTVGRHLADRVIDAGVSRARVSWVYRPVRGDLFSPGCRSEARARLNLPTDVAMVLWVGRFVAVKGLKTLVDAVTLLRRTCPSVLLCLVGEGPQLAEIKEAVSANHLREIVRFVGPVANADLVHWYRAANVTVLPSLSEGIPNVLLESIACGTPFVASSVGGIAEIADSRLDSLVAPGRPEALAAGLADHLSRPRPIGPRAFTLPTADKFNAAIDAALHRAVRSHCEVA